MRRLLLLWLGVLACAADGCSLRSLDELNRCTGEAVSAECPSEGAGNNQGGAQAAAGGVAAGGVMSGAGSPDAGGALGEAGVGGAGAPEPEPELVLLYADNPPSEPEPEGESKAIRPIFVIENLSAEPVDVSELRIRYYYTLEAPSPQTYMCDFVDDSKVVSDCDAVLAGFGELSGEAMNYAELSFAVPDGETWLISPLGGRSGPIQVRFYKTDFDTQDQSNDYSYDAQKVEVPEPWDHVTLYRSGELVWGVEPP